MPSLWIPSPNVGGDTSVLLLILGFETADLPGLSCVPVPFLAMWVLNCRLSAAFDPWPLLPARPLVLGTL